jgi:Carboxypeptidase regulatory-like domain
MLDRITKQAKFAAGSRPHSARGILCHRSRGSETRPAITNAEVQLSNTERGIDRHMISNSVGAYSVGGLSPGPYKLTVTAPGFQKYTADFVLRVAERIRADTTLQLPTANTAITVQGDITHVETQGSDLSGTLTRKEITQLQLNGRILPCSLLLFLVLVTWDNRMRGNGSPKWDS